MTELELHTFYMNLALQQAQEALENDEVPVGAIIVANEKILAAAHNQREMLNDPTAHAEMIAITQAADSQRNWRLASCTLYVTLEPCPMCAGAILQSRISKVVYGARDPKSGAVDSLYQILGDQRLNHQADIISGIEETRCGNLLTEFFRAKRAEGKK